MFAELLQAALEMLSACDCTTPTGCPGCVHHMGCGEYNECLDKNCAIVILKVRSRAVLHLCCRSQSLTGESLAHPLKLESFRASKEY